MKWHQALGFGAENYRFHDHDKLAHYANAATDIEFKMPFGFKEVEGIHSRTNFDLSQHEKYSGKSIKYFDPQTNERIVCSSLSCVTLTTRRNWRMVRPVWC